jgi:hypothetical protein
MPIHRNAVNTGRSGHSDVIISNKQQIATERNFEAREKFFNARLTF